MARGRRGIDDTDIIFDEVERARRAAFVHPQIPKPGSSPVHAARAVYEPTPEELAAQERIKRRANVLRKVTPKFLSSADKSRIMARLKVRVIDENTLVATWDEAMKLLQDPGVVEVCVHKPENERKRR